MEIEIVPLQVHLQEKLDETIKDIVGSLRVAYIGKIVSRKDDPEYKLEVDDVTMCVFVDEGLQTTHRVTFWGSEENHPEIKTRALVVGALSELANLNDHGRRANT